MERSEDDFISKSERKRRYTALQDVGAALVKLSREQLARIDMPEELREAVLACQSFTRHEAVRRQMQYIGKVMRDIDSARIAEQLAALEAPSKRQTALFHVAEKWRDELLADPAAIERFEREFPQADAARVKALLETARRKTGKHETRHTRELFHAVNAAVQEAAKTGGSQEPGRGPKRMNRGLAP
jgi:ribosome-associated protein